MRNFMRFIIVLIISFFEILSSATAQQSGKAVKLEVDLRVAARRIYHAKMEFAVKPGPFTLVYPKWIPGEHAPNGPIVDVTGVKFFAGGKEVNLRRGTVGMFAFRCQRPVGAGTLAETLRHFVATQPGA